jgi:hypothetical protein
MSLPLCTEAVHGNMHGNRAAPAASLGACCPNQQTISAASVSCAQVLRCLASQVVLLMPFLATDWSSSRQGILRFAANFAPLLGSAAGAVGRLPHWLQDKLVRLAQPGVEQHAHGSMKALMTAGGVHNNFHLAQHEFRWASGSGAEQRASAVSRVVAICGRLVGLVLGPQQHAEVHGRPAQAMQVSSLSWQIMHSCRSCCL